MVFRLTGDDTQIYLTKDSLATENRTQDAGHARFNISTKNKTESAQEFGRYHDTIQLIKYVTNSIMNKVGKNQR